MLMGVVPMLGAGVAWCWPRRTTPSLRSQAPSTAELGRRFIQLQAAWDACDIAALRHMTTESMLRELCLELPDAGDAPNCTHVVTLHTELLGFERLDSACVASVAFSGLMQESAQAGAVPFKELWLLTRSNENNAHWKLARQHTLM